MMRPQARRGAAALALVIAFVLALPARAEWTVNSLQRQPGPGEAIEYRHYSLGTAGSSREVELRLALFSQERATLRVIDQPGSERKLAGIMAGKNYLAGVNGGYFDPGGAPVGLLISGGKMIAPFRKARLLSGVLAVREGKIDIFRASAFPRQRAWREALQCGPFLVERGKAVAGLDATRAARRTFVLLANDGRVALGNSGAVTLADLGGILSTLTPLPVARALNLDGGSSSAFWCRTDDATISIAEFKTVRNFVAVVPRQ